MIEALNALAGSTYMRSQTGQLVICLPDGQEIYRGKPDADAIQEHFKEEHEITISKRGRSRFTRREIVRRARLMLNKEIHDPATPDVVGYDLIDRNCEHFAYWCRTGEWRSFQIEDNLSS